MSCALLLAGCLGSKYPPKVERTISWSKEGFGEKDYFKDLVEAEKHGAEVAGEPNYPPRPILPDYIAPPVNLLPFLLGKIKTPPHKAIYLRKFDQNRFAVRHGDYKIIIPWKGGSPQLYDLKNDIAETTDVSSQYPAQVIELDSLRKKWNSELVEPTFLGLIHLPRPGKKGK